MVKVQLPGVSSYRDRHGGLRWRYRYKGAQTSLKGQPGSAEFMASYNAAVAGHAKPEGAGAEFTGLGSNSWLIVKFYGSPEFAAYRPSTKDTMRRQFEWLRKNHGDKPFVLIEARHVRMWMDAKRQTPNAANTMLKALRNLSKFAVDRGYIKQDKIREVRKVKVKTDGYLAWTEDQIAAFEAHHKPGTRARLAFMLLLYTGQRKGDVHTLGPQHLKDGRVRLKQEKTGQAVDFAAPKPLLDELALWPKTNLAYLVTQTGAPFTKGGFGNWFRDCVKEAGLSGVSSHGLRKSMARRLAEAGSSSHEIMAVTGHQTLAEVDRYTRSANRAGMGDKAINKAFGSEENQNKNWRTLDPVSQIEPQPIERKQENG